MPALGYVRALRAGRPERASNARGVTEDAYSRVDPAPTTAGTFAPA